MWVCAYCETENSNNSAVCACCGRARIKNSSKPPQNRWPTPTQPVLWRTMKIIALFLGTFFLILVLLAIMTGAISNVGEKKSTSLDRNNASASGKYYDSTSGNSSKHTLDVPISTNSPCDSSSQSTSSNSCSSNASTSTSSATTSSSKANGSPSDSDLTAASVTANIRYPKDKYYLSEYKYGYIDAPKGDSVIGFKYSRPSEGTDKVCYPKHGEAVTILALQYGRACVIVDSTQTACWINQDYIRYI